MSASRRWASGARAPRPRRARSWSSFGDATLLLTDLADRPLGHWALAGIPGGGQGRRRHDLFHDAGGRRDPDHPRRRDGRRHRRRLARLSPRRRRRPAPPPLPLRARCCSSRRSPPSSPSDPTSSAIRPRAWSRPTRRGNSAIACCCGLIETRGPLCAEPAGGRALARLGAIAATGAPPRVLDLGATTPVVVLPGPTVLIDRRRDRRRRRPRADRRLAGGWPSGPIRRRPRSRR